MHLGRMLHGVRLPAPKCCDDATVRVMVYCPWLLCQMRAGAGDAAEATRFRTPQDLTWRGAAGGAGAVPAPEADRGGDADGGPAAAEVRAEGEAACCAAGAAPAPAGSRGSPLRHGPCGEMGAVRKLAPGEGRRPWSCASGVGCCDWS